MLDPPICWLTRLLAAGNYPVETGVKRRWIDISREAATILIERTICSQGLPL